MTLSIKPFENIFGKGENVAAFSPFPTIFSTLSMTEVIISATFHLLSANALNSVQSKNLLTPFENIVDKEENAVYQNFLLLTLSQTSPGFYVAAIQVFRKHCGKRRNCS